MELMLQGKTALVTGAGQGVGRRIAMDLAAEGCRVVVNDFFADRAKRVADEIRDRGQSALAAQADICDAAQVAAMFQQMRKAFGPCDILVNNAGVPPALREPGAERPLFMNSSMDDQIAMVALNVHGTMNCCREALQDMVPRHGGRIVSIVSEAARIGEARLAVYSGAKAAILGFTMALAREHGRDAITVNAIALGAIVHEGITAGPLSPNAGPEHAEQRKKVFRAYPAAAGLGRLGTPEDVSAAVSFLVSERAAYITGQSLGVSGGFHMQ
jgi:NAD(P)-dependent dehydrogenase (short-subunit alcohol dehydrogenase family)